MAKRNNKNSNQTSNHKQQIINSLFSCVVDFKSQFVDKEILIFSSTFKNQEYYIIKNEPQQFKHLTGVTSSYNALEFYDKCMNKTLKCNEIDYYTSPTIKNPNKSMTDDKMAALMILPLIYSKNNLVYAQEDFEKGSIKCMLSTTDLNVTIGVSNFNNFKTLMKGAKYSKNNNKIHQVELIMVKNKKDTHFSQILLNKTTSFEDLPVAIKDKMAKSLIMKCNLSKTPKNQRTGP